MKYTFELTTTRLKNGIIVYGKKTADPFVIASIHIPVGHIHNTGSIVPGSMHLLEHMVCNRSVYIPDMGSLISMSHCMGEALMQRRRYA